MSLAREHRQAIEAFIKAHGGWEIDDSRPHLQMTHPAIGGFVTASKTPGCRASTDKALAMMLRKMREAGLAEKPKNQQVVQEEKTYGNPFPRLKTTAQERRRRNGIRRSGARGSGSFAHLEELCAGELLPDYV